MEKELKCTATVLVTIGKKSWHERCGQAAAEYVLTGDLTSAKAILCRRHKQAADAQIKRGREGKAKKRRVEPRQLTIPGAVFQNN
jgi:hypothetical protein